jgi:hypothetical protein
LWLAAAGLGLAALFVVAWFLGKSPNSSASVALQEPASLYAPGGAGLRAADLFTMAREAAAHGDVQGAIKAMQMAANDMAQRRAISFELWDDLAELYCVQAKGEREPARAAAARTNGLALLREARCGMRVYTDQPETACFLEDTALPNTELTPLCYTVMCTKGSKRLTADDADDLVETARRQRALERAAGAAPEGAGGADDQEPAKDEPDDAERAMQDRRHNRMPAQLSVPDTTYRAYYRQDAANFDEIEALCTDAK